MTDDAAPRRAVDGRIALGVFVLLFAAYFFFGRAVSFDSRFVVPTALGLLKRGTTSLDAYPHLQNDPIWVRRVDGHVYSIYPIGNAILAVPFVYVADRLTARAITLRTGQWTTSLELDDVVRRGAEPLGIELLIASCVVAATGSILFGAGRQLAGRTPALLAVATFAFGTSAWSTASRGLWQHGPSMLALSATLALLIRARERPGLAALAGLPLAFAYTVRPTNAIPVVLVTLHVALVHRAQLGRFLGAAALVAIPFLAFNVSVFHALFSPYYLNGYMRVHPELAQALAGNWLAPSRGILVYSPVLGFAFHGAVVRWRRGWTSLDSVAGLGIGLHWLAISFCYPWCGGNCYGPRYFTDAVPFFIYFLIPSLEDLLARPPRSRAAWLTLFAALLLVSVLIHGRGVTSDAVYQWNLEPVFIDSAPSQRAWDWHDIQFLRGL